MFGKQTTGGKAGLVVSFSLLAVALLVLVTLAGCGRRSGLAPGEYPPNFSLTDLQGKKHAPESFEGKNTVLSFWASWCEPCIKELPALERLHNRLKSEGFQVVSIGIDDSAENLRAEVEKAGVSFPVLVDEKGVAKRRYRVIGVPETFLIGSNGRLVMVTDPNGMPTTKLVGPREWDSSDTIAVLKGAFGQ